MSIEKIGGIYPTYPIEPIKRVELETVRQQDEIRKQQENEIPVPASVTTAAIPDNRPKAADLENISLTFNAGETFDYIGKDSDLSLLDTEKLISDMKKDSILEQYRYFVGSEEANKVFYASQSEDGIVVMK